MIGNFPDALNCNRLFLNRNRFICNLAVGSPRLWKWALHASSIKYAGVIWLLFVIGHLDLIGVWLGEDLKKKKHQERHIFKRD